MKLSIVIPVYNIEKYIKKTINSLIVQNKKQFEIIIVDDGSTDNTSNVVENIIQQNKLNNCKVIKKTNGGVSSARNKGLYEASGEYVMFLDGDDYVSIDLVENICEKTYNNKSDILFWGYNIVDENNKTINNYFDIYNFKIKNMTGIEVLNNIIYDNSMWIWTGSAAYRREFLLQYNLEYTQNCSNGEDQEFTFKALSRAREVDFINKVLSFYLQRETSISNSYNIKRFDVIAAMKRICAYIDNIENSELQKISSKIKNEHMVNNYMYNFNSCLSCIHKKKGFRKKNFQVLYNDIDRYYPGVNKEIVDIMRNYNENSRRILLKNKIFLSYPLIYSYLLNLKNKMKKTRKG